LRTLPISPIFIPANRLDFCHKAISSGADGVILDLEDSIPLDQKDNSLRELVVFLKESDIDTTVFVRINPPNTDEGKKDLAELSNVQSCFSSIIIPKAENIDSFIGVELENPVIALIESAEAVKNLESISSFDNLGGFLLGAADLSKSLGSDMSWDALLYTRSKLIIESSASNLMLIDSPYMNMADLEGLSAEVTRAKGMGFISKAAIHPNQIEVIRRGLLPTKEEIKEAKGIIEAFKESKGGVTSYNGKMIDAPIVEVMKRKLSLIEE
jgi:(S)-citramalyl-CoA lyase